ncbi:3-hydroxy-9,10-secoandrosta-1,3,5(10)-triene-9,17-dione monooxygenase [Oceanobacillus polygoni]|uniref:3-hydroxy-9,10-secoandrosta-1,3,5(10)-triene-9, 17-dione monooxygenase n=1 Tax=Oceanobacillus polygoni TaxID=1235259 RepID=A0A9X0YW61_9BACI|nr:acyl-CoA dehydrogenase [Oceanobacillus polygoni]MBP2078106.1 3-hydroxy-9,10-secoandrosta-1,3,5(10)-triene-9,17-dione monooxygenase [Oceanobacillus polygoni]
MSQQVLKENRLTEELLLEGAKKVGELAEQEAKIADEIASVSAKVVSLMESTGITQMMIPKNQGGPDIGLRTFAKVVRKVANYNLSAAWLAYLYPLHNMLPAYLPRKGQDEIFNQGGLIADIFAAIGTAEKDGDGYRISGKWNFVSGVNHADWVGVGVKIVMSDGDGKPEVCLPIIPVSELQIVENWDTFGLRGSGSNQVIAEDVYVPLERIFRPEQAEKTRRPYEENYEEDYPLYHVPLFPAFYFGFPLIALGGAERMIEEFKKQTEKRVRLMDGVTESESPRSQRVMAEITMEFKAAEALMDKYLELLENYEKDGATTSNAEFFAIRTKIVKATSEIALRILLTLGGGALYKGGPIELFFRDILSVATHKTSLYEDSVAAYGQELFGFESGVRG